jgi:Putative metal-binding motif/IPT/TIG domain
MMCVRGLYLTVTAICLAAGACAPPIKIDDARADTDKLALTLVKPKCLVATTNESFELSYQVDSDAKITLEATDRGEVRSLVRQTAVAGESGKLSLPPGSLREGTNTLTIWARSDKKISSFQSITLDVRRSVLSASADDKDGDCYSARTGDCDDFDRAVHPGATEVCTDGIDNDCNNRVDLRDAACVGFCSDTDKDGYASSVCGGTDCDDGNAAINPSASEQCNGVDDNCNGKLDEAFDLDGDLFISCAMSGGPSILKSVDGRSCPSGYVTCGDCDDMDEASFPGSANNKCPAFCADNDQDGYASSVCGGNDCNDGNADVHPGKTETCNGVDDNCDGNVDEPFDQDGDTYVQCPNGSPAVTKRTSGQSCPLGWATCADCADNDDTTYPDAPEFCLPGDTVVHSCKPSSGCVLPPACDISSKTQTGPVLFYTDIVSGPTTGGKNNNGVFITLTGLRFGSARGSSKVTIGGVDVAAYESWGTTSQARNMETIVIQPGAAVNADGDIVVTVGGVQSNPLPFKVRNGQNAKIYLVDPNASTNGTGAFNSPFNTLQAARAVVLAGDTVYVKSKSGAGFNSTEPNTCTNFSLRTSAGAAAGTTSKPIAYVGYPGDTPTIGGAAVACPCEFGAPSCHYELSTFGIDLDANYYVIASFNFTTNRVAINFIGTGRRFINNTFSNVYESLYSVGIDVGDAGVSDFKFYGNLLWSFGSQGLGLSGAQNVDIGWNEARYVTQNVFRLTGYRSPAFNIAVHDNFFHASGSAIAVGGYGGYVGNALSSGVSIYNNIISNPSPQQSDARALWFDEVGESSGAPVPSFATIEHNTIHHSDGGANSPNVIEIDVGNAVSRAGRYVIRNNIVTTDASPGQYFSFGTNPRDSGAFDAHHNQYHPTASPSAWTPDSAGTAKFGNPSFADSNISDTFLPPIALRKHGNFTPGSASPGVNAAVLGTACADYYGRSRTQSGTPDMGAIER